MNKYTVKGIFTSLGLIALILYAVATALVWGLVDAPVDIGKDGFFAVIAIKTAIVMLVTFPGIIILTRNMFLYEAKGLVIDKMDDEKKEGPMLFEVQDTRLWR